jgi:tetratricopeptide (TPR) repeat protein
VLRAEAGVGLVRLGAFLEARELLKPLVAADPQTRHPEAHAALAGAYYRSKDATEGDFTEAEGILVRLLAQRPQHPEAWAALGAVRKRRSLLREDEGSRRRDLEDALAHYRRDYERDLNAFYEGVNVVALGVVLWLRYQDRAALASAREALPAVAYAASLRLRKRPEDFWAAATIAETELHARLLDGEPGDDELIAAYGAARGLRPTAGEIESSLSQLSWLERLGADAAALAAAREGLAGTRRGRA